MNTNYKKALGFVVALGLVVASSASAASAPMTFSRNLSKGATGADVKQLQQLLNSCTDTQLSSAAGTAGSAGFETMYFGPATVNAVKAYQTKNGIAPVLGNFFALTRAAAASVGNVCGGTTPTPTPTPNQTGPITVSLASTNPASAYIVSGQATANLAEFTFSGNGTVSSVTLGRVGLSDQNTLRNVYLYDGATRITDGYSFNTNGEIVINGLNLAVSGSKTISVKADVTSGISGQTVGVMLKSMMVAGQTASTMPNLSGNLMSVSNGSGIIASASLSANTVAGAPLPGINPGTTSYTVWSAPMQVNTRALMLKGANFRMIGSAEITALSNIKMYVDGVDTGAAAVVKSINGSNYATFDFMSAPKSLSTGSHTVDVRADIIAGSYRNVSFSIQNGADLMVMDPQLGVNVNVSGTVPNNAGTINIATGTSTMVIDPTFNTLTNVTGGSTNATIAKYKITGYGEDVKVYNLSVTPSVLSATAGANSTNGAGVCTGTCGLNNVTLYFNGSQVGSQYNWTGTGPIAFTLNSQMVIPAGSVSSLEVKADLQTTANVNYTAGTVNATVAMGSNNAEGMSSHNSISFPGSAVATNALTIQTGLLGVSKNTAYASQTLSPNTAGQKVGSFILQNQSTSESIRVTALKVDISGSSALSNLSGLKTSETSGSGSTPVQPAATNTFSVDFTLAPGATKTIDVMLDTSTATSVNVISSLTVTSIGSSSNVSIGQNGTALPGTAVVGQTITLNAGVLGTPTFLASNSTNSQYVASPLGKADASKATYTFNSTSGPSTISELKFTVTGTDTVSAIKVGSVSAPVVAGVAWLQGLNIAVANGGTGTNVDAMVSYTTVGTAGTASVTSNTPSQVALTYVKYTSGGATTTLTPSVSANTMTLTGATPTVKKTSAAVNVGTGSTSNVKVGTVTITANDGDIMVGTVPVSIGVPTGGTSSNWTVKVSGTAPTGITQPTSDTSGFFFGGPSGYQIQKGTAVAFDIYVDFAGVTTAGNADVTLGSAGSFKWSDIVDGTISNAGMTKTGTLLTTYNQ